jgi:CO/xanthine dehydrogenase Mo-binding subunit
VSIGLPLTRREDERFLTGRGRYTENTAPRDALAVLFVRSPHAHARIVDIDQGRCAGRPGVVAIYTAEDTAADRLATCPAISEDQGRSGNRHREPSATCRWRSARCATSATSSPWIGRANARPGARCRPRLLASRL